MFIYSIYNILFVHSDSIIKNGELKIIDETGKTVKLFMIDNKDYASFLLDIPAGKYKVDLSAPDENIIKHIIINDKNRIVTSIE